MPAEVRPFRWSLSLGADLLTVHLTAWTASLPQDSPGFYFGPKIQVKTVSPITTLRLSKALAQGVEQQRTLHCNTRWLQSSVCVAKEGATQPATDMTTECVADNPQRIAEDVRWS